MNIRINQILRANPRNSARGAPMGASDYVSERYGGKLPALRCQCVFLVDGGYGPDGTYWGVSLREGHIYCAFNDGQDSADECAPAMGVRLYTRAFSYQHAQKKFRETYPEIEFVRGGR